MASDTTITVSRDTWEKLHRRKAPGDSFDDVVSRLIKSEESAPNQEER